MVTNAHLRLFEQPATTNQAVLSCGHRRDMPETPALRKDGWYAALRCGQCWNCSTDNRPREVVSVIYVKANT